MKKIFLIAGLVFCFSAGAQASLTALSGLTGSQTDGLFKTLAADFAFRPVEPAGTYGKLFGFSLGVVGTVTSTTLISDLLPGSNLKYIPFADLSLGVQFPKGFAIETGILPKPKGAGANRLTMMGGNLKWTINKTFFDKSLIDITLRGMYTMAEVGLAQNVQGLSGVIDYNTRIYGGNVSVGGNLASFIDPFVGFGFVKHVSSIASSLSLTLFDQSFTTSSRINGANTGTWLYVGAQKKLFMVTIAAQYEKLFGTDVISAKLGVKF